MTLLAHRRAKNHFPGPVILPSAALGELWQKEEERMAERIIQVNGVKLATEAFGDAKHPPILLIMGAMASMLWWPDAFCKALADRSRFVIRYDQRDTGLSTKYPPGQPGYTFDDLLDDAFRVLDGYSIPAAHIAGMSLGGMIGQVAASWHPSRVLSLTAISSTPVGVGGLPGSRDPWASHTAEGEKIDWTARDEVVGFMLEESRLIAGTAHRFDATEVRAFIERDYDRSGGLLSATNHGAVMMGEMPRVRLKDIKAPLLVIHGTADPVFPREHGAALAAAVPGARVTWIGGGGHELHEDDWDAIVGAIVEHTGAWRT
jgi:pimeloyl-ACP methyl ester carboxylesterase